jgi:hypothetical protein
MGCGAFRPHPLRFCVVERFWAWLERSLCAALRTKVDLAARSTHVVLRAQVITCDRVAEVMWSRWPVVPAVVPTDIRGLGDPSHPVDNARASNEEAEHDHDEQRRPGQHSAQLRVRTVGQGRSRLISRTHDRPASRSSSSSRRFLAASRDAAAAVGRGNCSSQIMRIISA